MGSKKPLGGPKAHAALVAARAAIISELGSVQKYRRITDGGRAFDALEKAADAIWAVSKHLNYPDWILATAWWSYWDGYMDEDELHPVAIGSEPMSMFGCFIATRTRQEIRRRERG